MDLRGRRETISQLLDAAISAVDAERLTRDALETGGDQVATLVAIGKAAAAMCRGAAQVLASVTGICVTDNDYEVPPGVTLMVGDHPVPGSRSFLAGQRVIEVVSKAAGPILALISGGGSALCEYPIEGVSRAFLSQVNQHLLRTGVPIAEMNLVRRHLSAIKGGRLTRFSDSPIETLAISDVYGPDPAVIASGPTIPQENDPEAAVRAMLDLGIDVPPTVRSAIELQANDEGRPGPVRVLADGRTAAGRVVEAAKEVGLQATQHQGWLTGDVTKALDRFLETSQPGLTVGSGEPDVPVTGDGRGGRNTHAALLAASRLRGTGSIFVAFATDGSDGNSGSAGAMVDGTTVSRGGDPAGALERSDSASYLAACGDLIVTGPTGTNVSDLWVLWR